MPFIIRKIEPHYIGRGHVPQDTTSVEVWPIGAELGAITNGALATTLKQLASLLANAEDIFHGLSAELTDLTNRSGILRNRIHQLDDQLSSIDPKKTPVPESDICSFATRTNHYEAIQKPTTGLFSSVTRPKALRELYEAAAVIAIRNLDSLRRERDGSALNMYMCTPVLGKRRRRDQSLDIESRVPAILDDLRKWTSSEALGDVTVPPDSLSRIIQEDDGAVDHKLPSPEERVQAIALKFPAEIVAVDVSGRGFVRMSMRRKSLLLNQTNKTSDNVDAEGVVKRRSRIRRPRGDRRNTLAGTDCKEIKRAINIENESAINGVENIENFPLDKCAMPKLSGRAFLSTSTDTLEGKNDTILDPKWNFDALKAWGRSRLKRISPKTETTNRRGEKTVCKLYGHDCYDTINGQGIKLNPEENQGMKKNRSSERKPSLSSLSGKSASSSIVLSVNTADNRVDSDGVILRESAAQKRERRKGNDNRDDPLHSSSGNWSASSESGRASIGSETTTSTTHPARSTSTTSTGTCSTRLSQSYMKRFRCRDTSTSSSVTSEGTLTPDIIHDIGTIPFSDEIEAEGETCSVYSCDTEGYYTSFHMDSGLKTLREEELTGSLVQPNPLVKTSDVNVHIGENEYELFGRGSTSTTTSSAGTVCTTLMAPQPPERKSSLTVVAMVHRQSKHGGVSPDSGHNTSSSPVESASSPACCTARSCSELEYSESSDLEGCDRIERIRSKTAISTSRIPSMCVITPPGSDDEQQRQQQDESSGSVLMSATVGTSQMKVINGDDKNLYATVHRVDPQLKSKSENTSDSSLMKVDRMNITTNIGIKSLSGVLGKLRCVLPTANTKNPIKNVDSGDYVTIADVRNNNDKCRGDNSNLNTYANSYHISQHEKRESEYVSLNELPRKSDSSLERKRHGARVTLDSEGKVIYASDSLKRRRGTHTTFNPGPFVKDTWLSSSMLARSPTPRRPVTKTSTLNTQSNEIDSVDCASVNKPVVIRANKSIQEPNGDRMDREQRQIRGAYVNIQYEEDSTLTTPPSESIPAHGYITGTCNQNENNHHSNIMIQKLHHYHTMPNPKTEEKISNFINPQRSVTPDITRELGNDGENYRRYIQSQQQMQIKLPKRCYSNDHNCRNNEDTIPDDNAERLMSCDSQRRYLAPMSVVNAIGYRFFASSPTTLPKKKWNCVNALINKSPTLSPIAVTQKVRDNFSSKKNSSDRTQSENDLDKIITSNNIFTRPPKSTMSNEELFSAIYKSKRKLNIKNKLETTPLSIDNTIMAHSNMHLERAGSRHSWSPESTNIISNDIGKNVKSNLTTARRDFKRLLLHQSTKIGPNRLSATEQLKLSRQQQPRRNQSPINTTKPQHASPLRTLSPRATWKFQTPRSDVLSSTIIEDSVAEERAMKPFQQHLMQYAGVNNRANVKRQLNLPEIIPHSKMLNKGDIFSCDNSENQFIHNNRQLATEFLSKTRSTCINRDQYNFRTRSESPSQATNLNINKIVSRSPSASTLETAL